MMRKLFCILCLCFGLAAPLHAQMVLDRPFDASEMTYQEAAFLQDVLRRQGSYTSAVDGQFGRASLRALRVAIHGNGGRDQALSWRDVATFLQGTQAVGESGGWRVVTVPRGGPSFSIPGAILAERPNGTDKLFVDTAGNLSVRTVTSTAAGATGLHQRILASMAERETPYKLRRNTLLVTSGQLRSGYSVYARSDPSSVGYVTTMIHWQPIHQAEAQRIAESLPSGGQVGADLPFGGILALSVAALDAAPVPPPAQPASGPSLRAGAFSVTGTFVNNTDIVSSLPMHRACRGLTLADGTELAVVAQSPALDLVVLTSAVRSSAWARLPYVPGTARNAPVTATGLRATDGQSVRLANASGPVADFVDATAGQQRRMVLELRLARTAAGGIVQGADGQVTGIIVAKPARGAPPRQGRSLRYAVPIRRVQAFLGTSGIVFDSAPSDAPGQAADALVPLHCRAPD